MILYKCIGNGVGTGTVTTGMGWGGMGTKLGQKLSPCSSLLLTYKLITFESLFTTDG